MSCAHLGRRHAMTHTQCDAPPHPRRWRPCAPPLLAARGRSEPWRVEVRGSTGSVRPPGAGGLPSIQVVDSEGSGLSSRCTWGRRSARRWGWRSARAAISLRARLSFSSHVSTSLPRPSASSMRLSSRTGSFPQAPRCDCSTRTHRSARSMQSPSGISLSRRTALAARVGRSRTSMPGPAALPAALASSVTRRPLSAAPEGTRTTLAPLTAEMHARSSSAESARQSEPSSSCASASWKVPTPPPPPQRESSVFSVTLAIHWTAFPFGMACSALQVGQHRIWPVVPAGGRFGGRDRSDCTSTSARTQARQ
mmetsp:Transcript_15806/g.53215  ORF Transcript_15806/g.53215 Transcript_15806/m.53215 type:complete len:309 (+) Transcript_15806:291-1217(+)